MNKAFICMKFINSEKCSINNWEFIFESLITLSTTELKNKAADAALKFMQKFTDNDGIFISFTRLDTNNWIYQLNFRIS